MSEWVASGHAVEPTRPEPKLQSPCSSQLVSTHLLVVSYLQDSEILQGGTPYCLTQC